MVLVFINKAFPHPVAHLPCEVLNPRNYLDRQVWSAVVVLSNPDILQARSYSFISCWDIEFCVWTLPLLETIGFFIVVPGPNFVCGGSPGSQGRVKLEVIHSVLAPDFFHTSQSWSVGAYLGSVNLLCGTSSSLGSKAKVSRYFSLPLTLDIERRSSLSRPMLIAYSITTTSPRLGWGNSSYFKCT